MCLGFSGNKAEQFGQAAEWGDDGVAWLHMERLWAATLRYAHIYSELFSLVVFSPQLNQVQDIQRKVCWFGIILTTIFSCSSVFACVTEKI